ncbi:MAG: hypothetical protein RLY47_641 [Candidatus Parcubacteria bacterium]|jgi:HAMP domain-containing protein
MDPVQTQTPSQGPIVGIIVVIIVLIVGAFYFFTRIAEIQNAEQMATTTEEFATTSPSDDTAAIESDLDADNFDNLDAEMGTLNGEFGY